MGGCLQKIYFIPPFFVNTFEMNCSIKEKKKYEAKEPKADNLTSISQPDPAAFPTEGCTNLLSKA